MNSLFDFPNIAKSAIKVVYDRNMLRILPKVKG